MKRQKNLSKTRGKHPCDGLSFSSLWHGSDSLTAVQWTRGFFSTFLGPVCRFRRSFCFHFGIATRPTLTWMTSEIFKNKQRLHFYVTCLNICCPLWGPCRNCLLLDICVAETVRVSIACSDYFYIWHGLFLLSMFVFVERLFWNFAKLLVIIPMATEYRDLYSYVQMI